MCFKVLRVEALTISYVVLQVQAFARRHRTPNICLSAESLWSRLPKWEFPKLGVPYFGVLIIRILLFRVLY